MGDIPHRLIVSLFQGLFIVKNGPFTLYIEKRTSLHEPLRLECINGIFHGTFQSFFFFFGFYDIIEYEEIQ